MARHYVKPYGAIPEEIDTADALDDYMDDVERGLDERDDARREAQPDPWERR